MSQQVDVGVLVMDLAILLEAAANLAIDCINERRMKDSRGTTHEVDHVLQDSEGHRVGVKKKTDGTVDLIPQKCDDPGTDKMVRRLTQHYARGKVLNELKQKGYQVVKEEVQPDRSIRVVVQRWQ